MKITEFLYSFNSNKLCFMYCENL